MILSNYVFPSFWGERIYSSILYLSLCFFFYWFSHQVMYSFLFELKENIQVFPQCIWLILLRASLLLAEFCQWTIQRLPFSEKWLNLGCTWELLESTMYPLHNISLYNLTCWTLKTQYHESNYLQPNFWNSVNHKKT